MKNSQYFTIYNTTTGQVYITKGRRAAERIALTANKLCRLLNLSHQNICASSLEFFKKYHIDKSKIHFCWDVTLPERMDVFKLMFKSKDLMYGK